MCGLQVLFSVKVRDVWATCCRSVLQVRLFGVLEGRVEDGVMASENSQALGHRELLQLPGVRRQGSASDRGGKVGLLNPCIVHGQERVRSAWDYYSIVFRSFSLAFFL